MSDRDVHTPAEGAEGTDPTAGFSLHPRLEADTLALPVSLAQSIGPTDLCEVRLANDRRFPWVILIPRRAGVTELHDLSPADQQTLMAEITRIAAVLKQRFKADKVNVATLGNLVPQLHIHIVMRFTTDPAWPGPIWGHGTPEPYGEGEIERMQTHVERLL